MTDTAAVRAMALVALAVPLYAAQVIVFNVVRAVVTIAIGQVL